MSSVGVGKIQSDNNRHAHAGQHLWRATMDLVLVMTEVCMRTSLSHDNLE